ncbi:hypothetical protein Fcan01_20996 [Folsomia candida]|uniref:F-box domain-containing protein n=1 Tax=Folsomia candida TaxID=158441 RepID=A0A226DGR3_FOLCA|nr:hypothetical protein Fcan01_20996 [Folsomia candida]
MTDTLRNFWDLDPVADPAGVEKEMLDLPVMPKLVTLAVECIYQIQNSLDETRLPKLKDLTLFKFHEVSDLTTRQKNPWRRHRGIQSVTMRMQGTCKWETFSETMVQLFPSVKEFHFTWFASYVPIDHVTKFLEPFQGWNLERADVVLLKKGEPASQTILAGLRSMATWKGEIKTATFYFNADRVDFTAHVDDFIRCSEGFANAGYFAG